MALLPHNLFQPPVPPILLRLHPASPLLWIPRLVLLGLTTAISLPLLVVLVPVSVVLLSAEIKPLRQLAPLPLHPDNLPPRLGAVRAIVRGVVAYYVSAAIWAITSIGLPPDQLQWLDEGLARLMCLVINLLHVGSSSRLVVAVDHVAPYSGPRLGVLQEGDPVALDGYWLRAADSSVKPAAGRFTGGSPRQRKVILWLAGGGYITGYPLVHPFLFSLMWSLSASYTRLDTDYSVFAPSVRRALSRDRSFPSPLLDALAGWEKLRRDGWAAEDIIIMGDSAGGGLTWSLGAYLAVLQISRSDSQLGVPGGLVMISPWLSLPPCPHSPYPDLVDTPHLTTAARCYLARYPFDDVDPFMPVRSFFAVISSLSVGEAADKWRKEDIAQISVGRLEDWLCQSTFERLSSHHPLVSPSSESFSSFVDGVLGELASSGTKILLYAGTAEWFYSDTLQLARQAVKAGADVQMREEKGGYHIEPCVLPAELWGPSKRLVDCIQVWLQSPRTVRSGVKSS